MLEETGDVLLDVITTLDEYRDGVRDRDARNRLALFRFGQHNNILIEELLQNKAALNWAVSKIDELCGIRNVTAPNEVASAIKAAAFRMGLIEADHSI